MHRLGENPGFPVRLPHGHPAHSLAESVAGDSVRRVRFVCWWDPEVARRSPCRLGISLSPRTYSGKESWRGGFDGFSLFRAMTFNRGVLINYAREFGWVTTGNQKLRQHSVIRMGRSCPGPPNFTPFRGKGVRCLFLPGTLRLETGCVFRPSVADSNRVQGRRGGPKQTSCEIDRLEGGAPDRGSPPLRVIEARPPLFIHGQAS